MTYDDSAEVEAGALWLDQVTPVWPILIDTATLRMESCHDCIFGQLFGSVMYDEVLAVHGGAKWLLDHGFSVYGREFWLEEIEKRL